MIKKQMAPGPVALAPEVLQAMAKQLYNPDLDPDYVKFYRALTEKIQRLLRTTADCLVLSGEGILGLEAACASLIEPGTLVLCLANGVFGAGFVDFVNAYGGTPIVLRKDYRQAITGEEVRKTLLANPGIRVATMVHCDTPSGVLNPIHEIGPVLKEFGVISIVDAVASIGGDTLLADEWGLDVVLGGSQKALAAPPGLTFLSISQAAWDFMLARRYPPQGLYLNLLTWRDSWLKDGTFPYTQPVNDHYALDAALDLALSEGEELYQRHRRVAEFTRKRVREMGFELYPENAFASTVTALCVPERVPDEDYRARLLSEYGWQIAGSYGPLAGKVWRIGHMGTQADEVQVEACLRAMVACLQDF